MIDTNGTALHGLVLAPDVPLPENLSFEDWRSLGQELHKRQEDLNWMAGRWLQYGRDHYSEQADAALKEIVANVTGHGASALKQALWMADKYPEGTRVPGASFTAHRIAAAIPDVAERTAVLEEARDKGLSSRQVVERVKERRPAAPTVAIPGSDAELLSDQIDRLIDSEQRALPEPVAEPPSTAPPTTRAEELLLIADCAAFIRDRVLTKIVTVNGEQTRHDRHCTATADRLVCAEKCAAGQALVARAELI